MPTHLIRAELSWSRTSTGGCRRTSCLAANASRWVNAEDHPQVLKETRLSGILSIGGVRAVALASSAGISGVRVCRDERGKPAVTRAPRPQGRATRKWMMLSERLVRSPEVMNHFTCYCGCQNTPCYGAPCCGAPTVSGPAADKSRTNSGAQRTPSAGDRWLLSCPRRERTLRKPGERTSDRALSR